MRKINLPGLSWFISVPFIVFCDQITKWLVLRYLTLGESIPIFPGFNITLSYNRGIAFSLLNQQPALGQWLLITSIVFICVIIGVWLANTPRTEKWSGVSLLFILGGALGNLADRLVYGHVIDFIDVYIKHWHFYTFNVADAFITVGALMMIRSIFHE